MRKPSIRILVVDDFAPWRRLTQTMLREKPELQVVCEVSDGLEAVRKAQELKPDLILLDIGLPTLGGIAAARRIRDLVPTSKILFVSENYSVEIAREALNTGGCGYVIKSDAGSELLAAVDAVIRGKQFVSARLAGQLSTSLRNAQALDAVRIKEILASFSSRIPRNEKPARCHEVQFYSEEPVLLDRLSRFVRAALDGGGVVVGFATEPHHKAFVEGLHSNGLDVRAAMKKGTYKLLDVADTISSFMVNNSFDPVRYLEGMADLVDSARKVGKSNDRRVAVFGELAVPLLAQGNVEAAIQIERLSNEFAHQYEIDILCTYPLERSRGNYADHVLQRICAEHTTIYSDRKN